jgi:hypothetical protein
MDRARGCAHRQREAPATAGPRLAAHVEVRRGCGGGARVGEGGNTWALGRFYRARRARGSNGHGSDRLLQGNQGRGDLIEETEGEIREETNTGGFSAP